MSRRRKPRSPPDAELSLLQLEHDNLAERKQALDRSLKEPVKVLKDLKEARPVENERRGAAQPGRGA